MRRTRNVGQRCLAGCAVTVALVALAACAPAAGDSTSGNTSATGSPTADADPVDPTCTKAAKVKIVEQDSSTGDTYAFSPSGLTIQRGAFLAITNRTDRVHELVSKPDAGMVSSVLDLQERQVIQFPDQGRFTVRSADAAHRAVLRVTVSGDSGCGAPESTLAITDVATGGYAFAPATLTVQATENFAVVNNSSANHTVICDPDPGGNGDNSKLDRGETQLLAIDKPGRYVCTSVQHRSAKVTVTVDGG